MLISGTDITPFTANIKPNFRPDTRFALKWQKTKGKGNWKATDRTAASDIYGGEMRLYGTETEINLFITELEANRAGGSNVISLSSFTGTDKIFGCDVDYSGTIDATVLEWSERRQNTWKGFTITVKIRALSPSFTGSAAFPDLNCLEIGYIGDANRTIKKVDSYNGAFSYSDMKTDTGTFRGVFLFTEAEMIGLRRYIATTRGGNVTISNIGGVAFPFGPRRASGYPYSAKITNFKDLGMWGVHRWRAELTFREVVS